MNRSRYLQRAADPTDLAILRALAANARTTARELARAVGLSAPSVTERMRRLEDRGIIKGYTIAFDTRALGKPIAAYLRIRPQLGEVGRVSEMLSATPQVVEADRVTGEECFVAKIVVADMTELEAVIDRFLPFGAASASVVQSSSVKNRVPKI